MADKKKLTVAELLARDKKARGEKGGKDDKDRPPAPKVASTSTALSPAASTWGRRRAAMRSRMTGTWPWFSATS